MIKLVLALILCQLSPLPPQKAKLHYILKPLPLPQNWRGSYVWLSSNTILLAETNKLHTMHFSYWNPIKRIRTPLNYRWTSHEYADEYDLSPNGKALISGDWRRGVMYVTLKTGELYTPCEVGRKYHFLRWFVKGERWLDLWYPFKHREPTLLMCDKKRNLGYELISRSPRHSVFNLFTEDACGIGQHIYTLYINTHVELGLGRYLGKPISTAYIDRYRLENRWKRVDKDVLRRYVTFQQRQRIRFPRMLRVNRAMLSPNGHKVAWAFLDTGRQPMIKQCIMYIGVSDTKTGAVTLLGSWKTTVDEWTNYFTWMPDSSGFSFYMNSQPYVVREGK